MIVAIYGSRRQEENIDAIQKFFETLEANGVEIIMHRNLYNSLLQLMPTALQYVRRVVDNDYFEADVAVSFGGDGTFLRTAMWVGEKEIPIVGVNTGHLGFLTTAQVSELQDVANDILTENYMIEPRQVIEVVSPRVSTWPFALNEVVVSKYDTSSMVVADTSINGRQLASYRADGLIIATPTGSTAYNLSVGGPILQPLTPVWVVSPISPHSLSMRPLVIANNAEVEIKVNSRATGFRLTLDGRTGALPVGSVIKLRLAPFRIHLICRKGHEFPIPLRNKLFWGVNGI